ncbi:hypothetical protein H4R35_000983, partial [Dimargaris xerosporica]
FRSAAKKKLEVEFHEGGQRDAYQVLCNGFTGAAISLAYTLCCSGDSRVPFYDLAPALPRALVLMYTAHYACCNGDTWASEVGTLHPAWPVLITTLRKVPPGTNGGVSSTGLVASTLGGLVIGLSAFLSLWVQGLCAPRVTAGTPAAEACLALVGAGAMAGLGGSLVNFMASLIVVGVTGYLAYLM